MTDQIPGGDAEALARLDDARVVYRHIFRALQASLEKLEAEEDTPSDARNRQELYRAHLKQLQSVFEIEGSLDTFGTAGGNTRIDLDAARREIRDRLDRIAERGGDR